VSVRISTWNLWWQFGPWEARQGPVIAELLAVDSDVCCLQEVWSEPDGQDQAENLAAATGFHMARTRSSDGSAHRFGNALLSRWPILESFTLDLPTGGADTGFRSALFAKIDVSQSAQPWWVISTHLDWRYTASALREEQLEAIVKKAAELRAQAAADLPNGMVPVVLAGDLNATAETDEIRRLTGLADPYVPGLVFTDSWAAVGEGPGHTWTRSNPNSPDAEWPRRRLDHVLVAWPRVKPTGNALEARLFGTEPRATSSGDSVVPSDHYGVVVLLDQRRPSS